MDFGSFLKRREFERQSQENHGQVQDPPRRTAGAPVHEYDGPGYYHNSGPDSSYGQPHPQSRQGGRVQWHGGGQVSTNMGTRDYGSNNMHSDIGFEYETPIGGLRPTNTMPGNIRSRGRGFLQNQSRNREMVQNKPSHQDETYGDAEITQSYKTSNYESEDQGSQLCDYKETYQSYEDYTQDDAPNNFADDTMYSTQYGFSANVESYIDNTDSGHIDKPNSEDKKVSEHGHDETVVDKEKGENSAPATTQKEEEAKEGEKKAGTIEKAESKKKVEKEKLDEDSEEDDDASQSVQHSRGLMGTLICMLGNDALNRKPDPLPLPQPAKLQPKEKFDTYIKQKESGSSKDQLKNDDDDYENEAFDIMDLPPEERDLNPDDFDCGPNSDLYCKICGVQTTSMKNFQDHLDGKNHRAKLVSISRGKIINFTKAGKKRIIMSESELGKKSFILEALESNQSEPIIGLSFITEYHSISQIMCVCNLCGVKFDHNAALSHLSGSKHRFQYMKEKRPNEYVHIKRFGGKKSQLVSFLQELSVDVERDDTRGEPVIKAFDTNEKTTNQKKSQEDRVSKNKQGNNEEDCSSGKQNSERPEQRNSNEKDNINNQEDSELVFNRWVESECTKSREARDLRKSPSPPPWRGRNDDMGHPYDRGDDRPNRPAFNRRRDRYSPGPPRFPQERFNLRGPHPPRFHHGHIETYPHNYPGHPPFPPHPSWGPRFNEPYRDRGNFPPEGPPGHPGFTSWERDGPQQHPSYSSREGAPTIPYLDPDPVRRLDMLKRARQEAGSVPRIAAREEPYLDPDPLKRILKREAVQKPKVIDYSHGTAMSERRPEPSRFEKADKWEDDIKSILGYYKRKGVDSLASLGNAYSSPERKPNVEKKAEKTLPFSKPYLNIPENKKRLQNLRKKAQSPPIPGIDKRPEGHRGTRKRSRSSSTSSSSSRSPHPLETESPKIKKSKSSKSRDHLARYSPLSHGQGRDTQQPSRRSRSRSPFSFSDRQARSSGSPLRPKMSYRSREKEPYLDRKKDEKEMRFDRRDKKSSTPDRKMTGKEIEARLGSANNPIRLFNEGKKEKDPMFSTSGFGKAHYSGDRSERNRHELSKLSGLSGGSRVKEDNEIVNPKLSATKNRDNLSREREMQSQPTPIGARNQSTFERKEQQRLSPPRSRKNRSQEKEESPLRDIGPRVEEREKKQQIYDSSQKTPYPDDSEDAQAERIADMLLNMSSDLTSSGDTQATLQALLSNPEVAETILRAQVEMEKKSSEKSGNERLSSAGRSEGHDNSGPHSSSHYSRPQRESAFASKGSERKSHAPTRERVAFSLSGKFGRGSLQQSAAFAPSSDEDAD